MNWKQTILTAVITLMVTVCSGLLVNWYTNNNITKKDKSENLVYKFTKSAEFKADSLKLSLYNLELKNNGDDKADNVRIKISFTSKIIDANSILIRTREKVKGTVKGNSISFKLDHLFSNDSFKINVAVNFSDQNPQVIIESEKSLGKPLDNFDLKPSRNTLEQILFPAVFVAILLLVPFLFILTKFFKKRITEYGVNLNNTGFLLIHNNLITPAKQLLTATINNVGGDSFSFSNLALAKCLLGESSEEYNAYLNMAYFVAKTQRSKFVTIFNEMLIAAFNKNYAVINELFSKGWQIDKSEFKSYLHYSKLIENMKREDQQLESILSQSEKNAEQGSKSF